MHYLRFILFVIVLSGSARGSLFDKIVSFFLPRKPDTPTVGEEKHFVVHEWKREEEVCFSDLGCFSMDEPWSSISIDIPPPSPPSDIPIQVTLRTRKNKTREYNIATYPKINLGNAPFNSSNPTVLIFDGFHANDDELHLKDLCDAYLSKIDANVMVVDWNPASTDWLYVKALSNARVVARILARFLNYLQEDHRLNRDDIHVIGHGLGIHPASFLCKRIRGIGRLTALNPAQPFLQNLHPNARLNPDDASFVDVIHTDSKPFMELNGPDVAYPMGDVDFYMNGGLMQPGCGLCDIQNRTSIAVSYTNDMKSCNHIRAVRYFAEAIKESDGCKFWGHAASFDEVVAAGEEANGKDFPDKFTSGACTRTTCTPLGLRTREYPARGVFVVKTRNKSPYCLQEGGIPEETELQ